MVHLVHFLLLGLVTVAAPEENVSPEFRFASKSNAVSIDRHGITVNDAFFPFGREMVLLSSGELCNATLSEHPEMPNEVRTRSARVSENHVVFLEAVRQRKLFQDDEQQKSRWQRFMQRYLRVPDDFLSHYYEEPVDFAHGVLTIANKGVAELRINHIIDQGHWLSLSMQDLYDPSVLSSKEMKTFLSRNFRDNRTQVSDVVYDERIKTMYHVPVHREGPPRHHTTRQFVRRPPEEKGSEKTYLNFPAKPDKESPDRELSEEESLEILFQLAGPSKEDPAARPPKEEEKKPKESPEHSPKSPFVKDD